MDAKSEDKFDFYFRIWKYLWWIGCIISIILSLLWNAWSFIHSIILLLGITLIYILYLIIKKWFYKSYPYKEMRNLVVETLKQIGCQPEIDETDEGRVNFMYQGCDFHISIENVVLITFYETWWGTLDLNDSNIERLKEAINQSNIGSLSKVVYSIVEENNLLAVHSMYRTFINKDFPDIPDLFKAILNDLFRIREEVKGRFNALKDEKVAINSNKRIKVKGFK